MKHKLICLYKGFATYLRQYPFSNHTGYNVHIQSITILLSYMLHCVIFTVVRDLLINGLLLRYCNCMTEMTLRRKLPTKLTLYLLERTWHKDIMKDTFDVCMFLNHIIHSLQRFCDTTQDFPRKPAPLPAYTLLTLVAINLIVNHSDRSYRKSYHTCDKFSLKTTTSRLVCLVLRPVWARYIVTATRMWNRIWFDSSLLSRL